jgi:hypothetical protein
MLTLQTQEIHWAHKHFGWQIIQFNTDETHQDYHQRKTKHAGGDNKWMDFISSLNESMTKKNITSSISDVTFFNTSELSIKR